MSRYRRSGEVRIDVSDVIDQIGDDDLIDEVRARKLHVTGDLGRVEFFDRDYAVRAYEDLLGGRPSDALVLLERALFPTLVTEKVYRKALAA